MNSAHFSRQAPIFHGKEVPEEGTIVGYAAIIDALHLPIPMVSPVALVCHQNRKYASEDWLVMPAVYLPADTNAQPEMEALYKHLVFALKYEGVNLLVFSSLSKHYSEAQLSQLVSYEPSGQYSRRIWFILEWLLKKELPQKEKLSKKGYVPLLDTRQQYAVAGVKSPRHLILNNLPGTPDFCPLIKKTGKLEHYINRKLLEQNGEYFRGFHKELIQRASAFLLLKDSRASFSIEGESPKSKRAARWGQAIGQAGTRDLSLQELNRLQQLVIENPRFTEMGLRTKGGFVGEHDRISGEPMPDHISARWQDLGLLIEGLLKTNSLLAENDFDAVLAAAVIAFGFVFIHPFEDGNGRIHRYLIHHMLAKKRVSAQGVVFPVSSSILNAIDDYRQVLEAYSHPLLQYIEWQETPDHNIEVLNETIDFYRYFDLTRQAEFLYDCVRDTIEQIIPEELNYLAKYEAFKASIDETYEMPDKMVAMLGRFLNQNNGSLSKRAREKEFAELTNEEVESIELLYNNIFN